MGEDGDPVSSQTNGCSVVEGSTDNHQTSMMQSFIQWISGDTNSSMRDATPQQTTLTSLARIQYMGWVIEVQLSCYLVYYQLISKPGNKTAAPSSTTPYNMEALYRNYGNPISINITLATKLETLCLSACPFVKPHILSVAFAGIDWWCLRILYKWAVVQEGVSQVMIFYLNLCPQDHLVMILPKYTTNLVL